VWGGAQKYVYDLATHLSKEAFHVTVAAGGRGPLKEKIETAGLRYIAVKNFERDVRILKEFSVFIELLKLCRNILPDIVHLNGSKAGVLGSIASTIACPKAKIIFTTHGLPYFEKRPKWQKLLIYLSLKLSALFQDTIIAISRLDYKNALRRHLIAPNKLVFIPISINPKDYHYLPKNEAKSALSAKISAKEATITNDAVVIGTIAEYTKNKGLTYLIDALASLNTTNYKLQAIVIGWGEEKKNLESKIKNAQLMNNIFLIENLENAHQYLKAFDIFILPSIKEGLPYTLLEAALAEVPIIATNVGGIPDIIEHNVSGIIVPPESSTHIAGAIETLINKKDLRETFIQHAKNAVLENFTFDKMLEKTLKVYAS